MPLKGYWAAVRLGGGTGASDKIPGADLVDKNMLALLESTDTARFYWLDDDASGSEGEGVTNPDTDPGTKSWLLLGITLPNTGLHILDSDASHDLIIKPGSDLSADRELTITTGDAARTLTLNENFTIADGYDVTLQALGQANSLVLNESLTLGDGYNGTLTYSADAKTLTVEDTAVVSQDYSADSTSVSLAGLSLTGNLVLAANSITGTSVDISNAELQQLSLIGATTISGAQWGYLGGASANGGALIDAADYAAMMALLSGEAGAAFSFNSQNLTSVGTIGCGTITTTGNLVLPANGVVGVTDGNPQIIFDNANNWLEITGSVGIGTATPSYKVDIHGGNIRVYRTDTDAVCRIHTTHATSNAQWILQTPNDRLGEIRFEDGALAGRIYYSHATDAMVFETAATLRMWIDSVGNVNIADHDAATIGLKLGGTLVTASAAELNILDGVTATTAEINQLDGNLLTAMTEIQEVETITGAVADGYAAALKLDPGYTAATAQTVTRHNYIDIQDVSVAGAGPAAVTNAAVMRFDAAIATHKAVLAAFQTTDSGTHTTDWAAGIIVNINDTLYKIPVIAV